MAFKHAALAGAGLMMAALLPSTAAAEAKLFPYHGENFCPAGLQPVTMGGVICCGTPNQSVSYAHYMMHPTKKKVRRKHVARFSARPGCTPGTKGCH
ncbi:MAG: hypothetical protein AAF744_10660 [Pseudomonadota bacterium]